MPGATLVAHVISLLGSKELDDARELKDALTVKWKILSTPARGDQEEAERFLPAIFNVVIQLRPSTNLHARRSAKMVP